MRRKGVALRAIGLSEKQAAVSEADRRAWQAHPQTALRSNSQRALSVLGSTEESGEDGQRSAKSGSQTRSPRVHPEQTSPRLAMEAISDHLVLKREETVYF